MNDSDFQEALQKKALGFDSDEIVEEYATDENGNQHLLKRKITKKHNPPDISALKLLLEQDDFDKRLENMTDGQLESEKLRLLQLLKEKENKNENSAM